MMTKQKYVEYLLSIPNHHTCPKLAEHWEGVSQDAVSDFWQRERLTPRPRGERVQGRIDDPSEALPRADDRLQEKRYSPLIERVKRPSSGHEQGRVKGMEGSIAGTEGDFWPMDDHLSAPETDGKTQHEPLRERGLRAVRDKQRQARPFGFEAG
jgi:hypothetical protein